jgi:hypothetical protein
MNLTAWLNPWWHRDFDVATSLPIDLTHALLTQGTTRLRARTATDGSLVLIRRGGLLNEFVRARVEIVPSATGSMVKGRLARPRVASLFFTLALPFLWLGVISQAVTIALRSGIAAATSLWPLFVIASAVWAAVIGANYTSARSEATDLQRLITEVLHQGASVPPHM